MDDNYQGIPGSGASINVTTLAGAGTLVPLQGITSYQPPGRVYNKATYTPMSGSLSGKQQAILCSEQAATIDLSWAYEALRMADMDAICGVNGCAIVLALPDGAAFIGAGGIEKHAIQKVADGKIIEADVTISLNAGWSFNPAAGYKSLAFNQALAAGVATLNLAAIPALPAAYDGTGKRVLAMVLTNPATNANSITVEVGATNGYAGFGAAFSVTVEPGKSVTVNAGAAIASGSRTLDLSGTGTQALSIGLMLAI